MESTPEIDDSTTRPLSGEQIDSGEMPPLSAAQKRRFVLLAVVLIFLLCAVVGEVAVRLFLRYNTPDTIRENSLQYRPTSYARHLLVPDQRIDRAKAWGDAAGDSDGTAAPFIYRINHYGYRGDDFPMQKAPSGCRLIVLGGSAVFDLGASEGEDWPHQVERLLTPRAAALGIEPLQVINAGVPGHSSADSVAKLYTDLWRFEPDAVLLYNAWNDIKTFTTLGPTSPLPDLVHPHDPAADPFQNYRGTVDRLLGHSQLYIKLRNRYFLWRYPLGIEGQVAASELSDSFDDLALRQFRLNVEMVVDASRNLGAEPILLTQATLVTADTSDADRQRIAYGYQGLTHEGLLQAVTGCNATVRQVATEKGTDLLDLASSLSGHSELFDDHVHTSRQGSQRLAEAVAEHLAPRLEEICR